MEIYIVALLKNMKSDIVGYRLVDIDDNNKVKDVNKQLLINVLSNNKLKLANAKLHSGTIKGISYPISNLPSVYDDGSCEKNKCVILKMINKQYMLSNVLGSIALCSNINSIRGNIINLDNKITEETDKASIITKDVNIANEYYKLSKIVSNSSIKIFDSKDYVIKAVPTNTFKNGIYLSTLIFRGNLKLDKNIANQALSIESIIIDKDVEFCSVTFNTIKDKLRYPTFYVVKGNKYINYLEKYRSPIIICDTLDDALKNVYKNESDNKLNKYDMMLQDNEYNILLDDKYRRNIDYLYKLLYSLHNKKELNPTEIVLDTSKFVEVSLEEYGDNLNNKVKTYCKNALKVVTGSNKNQKQFKRYKSMCNFVTTLLDNDKRLYSNEIKELFKSNSSYINNANISCFNVETYNSIECLNFIGTLTVDLITNIVSILIIVYRNNLVFMTPFIEDVYRDRVISAKRLLPFNYKDLFYEYRYASVANEVNIGDNIDTKNPKIHGAEFPSDFSIEIRDSFFDDCILVGWTLNKNDFKGSSKNDTILELLVLNTNNCMVYLIKALCYFDVDIIDDLYSIKGIKTGGVIVDKIGLCDIDKYADMLMDFYRASDNVKNNNSIKIASMNKVEIDNLFSADAAFDMSSNNNILLAAKYIYSHNIDDWKSRRLDKMAMMLIIKSGLLGKASVSLNRLKKTNLNNTVLKIDDGLYVMEYIVTKSNLVSKTTNLIGLIESSSPMSSTKLFYESELPLSLIIKSLYIIGYALYNKPDTNIVKISDEKINIDDFLCLFTPITYTNYYDGIKFDLAIEKCSGYTFLIGETWDTDFYAIFRFKEYRDAIDFLYGTIMTNKFNIDALLALYDGIVQPEKLSKLWHIDANYSMEDNWLMRLRFNIMHGLPNNYPYAFDDYGVFDKLAKQPEH